LNRIVLGALAALLLVAAGIFWWQGRAATERGPALPVSLETGAAPLDALPEVDPGNRRGPAPPELDEVTREQRRFDRIDRDRDGRVTRNEMLAPRVAAFRKLDVDHNNLLTFEEWAVRTSNRFRAADANGDQALTRQEFLATKPKRAAKPQCRCASVRRAQGRTPATAADDSDGEGGEPSD
jgi:hypothetical protein